MNDVAYAAQQFRRGLGNLAGLPVDLVNNAPRALNLLPGVDGFKPITQNPIGGSASINAMLDAPAKAAAAAVGQEYRDIKPATGAGQFVGRMAEEAGGAALPAAAVLRAAKTAAPVLSPAQKFFGVDKARVAPGQFVRDEAAVATATGAGAAGGQAAMRASGYQENSAGEQAGELGGGLAGGLAYGVGKGVLGPVANVLGAATGSSKMASRVVQEDVADTILRSLSTSDAYAGDAEAIAEAILRGNNPADAIPGFRNSTADRLRDPGLGALEFNRQSNSAGAFNTRRAENAAAVDKAVEASAPSGAPGQFSDALTAERDRRGADVASRAALAESDAASASAALAATTTPEQRGQMIREAVEAAAAAAVAGDRAAAERALRTADDALAALAPSLDAQTRGEMLRGEIAAAEQRATTARQQAYRAANVDQTPVPAAGLTERIDNALAGMTEVERSLVPQDLIDRVTALGRPRQDGPIDTGILDETGAPITRPAPTPPPVALKEATDLLSQLGQLSRAALADPRAANGGANVARVIDQLADQVTEFVRGVLSPEDLARLDAARAASFSERETFSRQGDAMARTLSEYRGGRYQVPSQAVPDLFIAPGADEQLMRLLNAADTPATRRALEEQILAQLARAGGDEAQIRGFLDAYARPLDQFPGLRDRIAAAADARRGATSAEEAVAARQREFIGESRALDDTLRARPSGAPAVPDASVPGRFAASETETDALLRAADTPEVRAALRDELVARVGALDNPERARAALDALAPQLGRFPGLRQQIEQAVEAGATARVSRQNQEQFVREMGGVLPSGQEVRGTNVVARWLTYGDENAARAMNWVVGQPNAAKAMDDLLRFVGDDPKAVEGARRAFWDLMEGKAKTQRAPDGAPAWSPANLTKFLDNPSNMAVAQRLYRDNPEHLENLQKIADALRGVDIRNNARAANTSGTAQSSVPIEVIQSSVFNVERGVVGPQYAIARVLGVWARRAVSSMEKRAYGEVLDRALLDPEFAAMLLKQNNPANRAALARGTRGWMGNRASDLIDALEAADDEDADMKRAIGQPGAR